MNFELYLANRLTFKANRTFSRLIVRIAIISIAISLAAMIISIAIVTGFQTEIRDKVIGFGSHIQISHFDSNNSFESSPISKNQDFYPYMDSIDGVKHIQVYATKAGIIKTKDEIEGILLKGIDSDFNWDFFRNKIISGNALKLADSNQSNHILISNVLASRLKLKAGDDLLMYFIQDPPRIRKFYVSGIYETGLEEFDKLYVFASISHIQKLNNWNIDHVGGFEILLDDFNKLEQLGEYVYQNIGYDLQSKTIKEIYPQIFDWLSLQDINVHVILILMTLVAIINMITALLVMVLERANMIGILKSLGSSNWSIRKIFLYHAAYLIGWGLFWGNLVGISICFFQKNFGIITLPQESYYVSTVPINLKFTQVLLLNTGTFLICLFALVLPSYLVTRIKPIKVIRFD